MTLGIVGPAVPAPGEQSSSQGQPSWACESRACRVDGALPELRLCAQCGGSGSCVLADWRSPWGSPEQLHWCLPKEPSSLGTAPWHRPPGTLPGHGLGGHQQRGRSLAPSRGILFTRRVPQLRLSTGVCALQAAAARGRGLGLPVPKAPKGALSRRWLGDAAAGAGFMPLLRPCLGCSVCTISGTFPVCLESHPASYLKQ